MNEADRPSDYYTLEDYERELDEMENALYEASLQSVEASTKEPTLTEIL
jgi:hypothetical protein